MPTKKNVNTIDGHWKKISVNPSLDPGRRLPLPEPQSLPLFPIILSISQLPSIIKYKSKGRERVGCGPGRPKFGAYIMGKAVAAAGPFCLIARVSPPGAWPRRRGIRGISCRTAFSTCCGPSTRPDAASTAAWVRKSARLMFLCFDKKGNAQFGQTRRSAPTKNIF
jgi:hypothetical protein